jgi:pyrimidine deaminase RibD-like protein
LSDNKRVASRGGNVAKKARIEVEKQIEESIISDKNSKYLQNKKINSIK